jgi:hypothetical protein
MRKLRYAFVILPAILAGAGAALAQGTQVEFGKNRVQYHRDFDEWSKYESDNFITYWYGEARNVGQAAVQFAEYDFARIQSILEHRINDKVQIIVYTDLSDLKQNNIGIEEAFTNIGGQTKIVGNKIFVYFDGNHNNLRRQVREGIASVYLDAMLFGSNLQEIVQNSVMLNLPDWFRLGLISYVGENWNTTLDNKLRDIVLADDFQNFQTLAATDPILAGHSLWYFISENFGRPTVSNLLYLTRINRSIENGFLFVLGSSYEVVMENWGRYFRQRYRAEVKSKEPSALSQVTFRNKRNLPVTQVKLSPDGRQLVYVTNEISRVRVYLHDLRNNERQVIFRGGFRNPFQETDYNYPIVAWNPNGQEIAILYEKRDVIRLRFHDVITGKIQEDLLSTEYQRVYSLDYVNPGSLVFSAAARGFSDIFLYNPKARQSQRITNDIWDDLDVAVVDVRGKKGLVFASNRPDTSLVNVRMDTILPLGTFDIFYYDLEERPRELVRVTNTPFANERNPAAVDSVYFVYTTDENGVYNREAAYLEDYVHHYEQKILLKDGSEIVLHADSSLASIDSAMIDTITLHPVIRTRGVSRPTTNYDRNLLRHHSAPRAGRIAELFLRDGRHGIFVGELSLDTMTVPTPTHFRLQRSPAFGLAIPPVLRGEEIAIDPAIVLQPEIKTAAPMDEGFLFQTEFEDEAPSDLLAEEETPTQTPEEEITILRPIAPPTLLTEFPREPEIYRFRPARITPYRLEFRTDYVTTRLDNSLLFEGLEAYDVDQDVFSYPPPGILFTANFKDLFEDYEVEGGIRVPTTFNGTEYFLIAHDKKKRLDKSYAIYRRNMRLSEESRSPIPNVPNKRESNILLGQFGLRYPFDIYRSVRATFLVRRDRITQLATERPTLERATDSQQRMGMRLEYVFDNTLDVSLNIKNGARYKFYGALMKKFDLQLSDGLSFSFDEGFMGILGLDARHYQRVLKHSVFATRFAAATSFGSEKMLYFLGGVDNWLFPSTNDDIPVPQGRDDLAFKALATNMRGFQINIRNGNSFAVANAELRVPAIRYLFPRTNSSLLRNFQVVGFLDAGTAWEGLDPFSNENPINTKVFDRSDQVSVRVNFFRDPIVIGYGVGARALLFGYFVRVDYGWGIETRRVQDPILHISLGMDF